MQNIINILHNLKQWATAHTLIFIIVTILIITFFVWFWFHPHGTEVQATLLNPNLAQASTLNRIAAMCEQTSPSL
jgi:ABC-type uncharacterized transport system permease subunit